MSWKPIYAVLLLATTILTYFCSILVEKIQGEAYKRKAILVLSLIANLGILIDKNKVDRFKYIIDKVTSKGTKLVVVMSPYYNNSNYSNTKSFEIMTSICKENGIPFLDNVYYLSDHPEYFRDYNHLNDLGAHAYTKIFIEQLKLITTK